MDKKGFSDEAKKNGGESKSFSNHLTNAEFSFPLAKSPQYNVRPPLWIVMTERPHTAQLTSSQGGATSSIRN